MFAKKYATIYDFLNQDKPYKKEIDFIYRWAKKPASIFDIGCGTASYWKYFPKCVGIFGLDKSGAMAKIALTRGHVIRGDITKDKFIFTSDCATALFNVVNYIPSLWWFKNIPIKKGGYFIFDAWDKKKVERDGFKRTFKGKDGICRKIWPRYIGCEYSWVELDLVCSDKNQVFEETHRMYVHSRADIFAAAKAAGFEVVAIKKTRTWQTWYKLRKK